MYVSLFVCATPSIGTLGRSVIVAFPGHIHWVFGIKDENNETGDSFQIQPLNSL